LIEGVPEREHEVRENHPVRKERNENRLLGASREKSTRRRLEEPSVYVIKSVSS